MIEQREDSIETIGRYQIQELVGAGSMGDVYKALDPLLHRLVAVKTVRKELLLEDDSTTPFKVRFYREAEILGSLSHPHIVSLYDMGEIEGAPYMVMEYGSPKSLASLLSARGALGLDFTLRLLRPLAEAIDYAHRASVVHLDLKPANVLLDEGGERPKVTDFGVAKILGNRLDSTLGLFGTPGYMSPEQVRSESPSHSSDLFSLAVVAFEMLCGERPFPGTSVDAVLYRVVEGDPVRPRSLDASGLEERAWHGFFSRALSKNPFERFPSATELVRELETLAPARTAPASSRSLREIVEAPSVGVMPTIALPRGSRRTLLGRRGLAAAIGLAGGSVLSLNVLGSSSPTEAGARGAVSSTLAATPAPNFPEPSSRQPARTGKRATASSGFAPRRGRSR